jgi:pilus assembly protein CpaE
VRCLFFAGRTERLGGGMDPTETRSEPPKAVLVGCDENTLGHVRHELDELGFRVEAESDNISEVASQLESAGEGPWLFIVDVKSVEDVGRLGRLNELFSGMPILALVDPTLEASLFFRAMRAGAAQVVRSPIQADDFRSAMERLAMQFGFTPSQSEVIVVSGVKSGCGATTVAINLAAQIAQGLGVPTILIEVSTQHGRMATYLNIEPAFTTHDLLSEPGLLDLQSVRKSLTKVAEDFHVLTGPYRAITSRSVAPGDMLRLIGLARRLAGAVVISVTDTFDALYFEMMTAASRVVLVTEQKVSSLFALRMIHDTLDQRGVSAARTVVINRFDSRLRDFAVDRVEVIAGAGNVATVANDYAAVVAAENHGRLLSDEAPRSRVLKDLDALARRLIAPGLKSQPERRTRGGFGARLGRLVSRN